VGLLQQNRILHLLFFFWKRCIILKNKCNSDEFQVVGCAHVKSWTFWFFHFGREQSIHGLRSTHFIFETEILLQRRITFRLNGLTQKECYYFCLHRSANIKVELCKSIMCRREQPKMMRSINNTLENENFKLDQNEEKFMNNMLLLIQKTSSAICLKIKAWKLRRFDRNVQIISFWIIIFLHFVS